jgi:hypothetical protein
VRTIGIGAGVLVALVVASGAISQELDVAARNQQVVRDNLAEINRGDVRGAASDWAEDAQNFGRPAGPERIQLVKIFLQRFPITTWR